ncbi:unnamed protein product, partial [Rotaria sordida]
MNLEPCMEKEPMLLPKTLRNYTKKRVRVDEHSHFLKKCKRYGLIPNGLRLKITTFNKKNIELIHNTSRKLRNNLFEYRYKEQRMMNIEINTQNMILKLYLKDCQSEHEHDEDLYWINKHDLLPREKLIDRHERKLQNLINKKLKVDDNNNNNN